VSRLRAGLPTVAAAADGRCKLNARRPVRFGENAVSTCLVPLTLSALEAFCNGTGTLGLPAYLDAEAAGSLGNSGLANEPPLAAQLLDGLLYESGGAYGGNRTYVGNWADANPEVLAEWNEVSPLLGAPSQSMSWSSASRTCSNVPVGVAYEFLHSKVGNLEHPQHQVSYARLQHVYADWTFADPLAANTAQLFALSSTTRFVPQKQGGAEDVYPLTPPLFPKLPDDFFYPFLSGDDTQ